MKKNNTKLTSVPETLLISLNARCNETVHPKGLIKDEKSLEIAEKVGSDFRNAKSVHLTNVGTAMRTIVFDRYTRDFLSRYPDGTIVNLACGLDTRYHRLGNGMQRWFDLDFPEVIEIRRKLFYEDKSYKFISKSVLDFSWMDDVPKDKPVFLSAEGLFCYFTEEEVKTILTEVAKAFPKAEFTIEAIAPFMVKETNHHPSLKGYDATFKWGTNSGKVVDAWNTGFHFIDEYFFMSMQEAKKRSFTVRLLSTFVPKFAKCMKIFKLRNFIETK